MCIFTYNFQMMYYKGDLDKWRQKENLDVTITWKC